MSEKIKIAVDAMGGDGSPKKVIDGIIYNHQSDKSNFYKIFGDKNKISPLIENKINEEFYESKIQFCIAARDPEGNPTTGITRYNANWNSDYNLNGVSNGQGSGWDDQQMKAASGCWNPSEYLNYYIVSEINGNDGGNGIQGYAYLGPTNDCRDGVVVLYNATGTVEEVKPGRTLGFTGVHEVGHYLSLFHTFSNTNEMAVRHISRSYDFWSKFTGHILSHEVKSLKPDGGIYKSLEVASGREGESIIYLDDRPENIEVGRARGWRACCHQNTSETRDFLEAQGVLTSLVHDSTA